MSSRTGLPSPVSPSRASRRRSAPRALTRPHHRISPATLLLWAGAALTLFPAPGISAQEAPPEVEYRKTTMQAIRHHFGALRSLAQGAVGYEDHAIYHARSLEMMAHISADAFPEGSGHANSRALPVIWEDRDGFVATLQAFQAATSTAVRAAELGDMQALQRALGEVGQGCRSCHTEYRAEN